MSRWRKPVQLSADVVVAGLIGILTYACVFLFLLASFFTAHMMADNVGSPAAWFGSSNLFLFCALAALAVLSAF